MEIAAALIIACSNLIQPSQYRSTIQEAIDTKKACIARVAECVDKQVNMNGLTRERTILKECSGKVH